MEMVQVPDTGSVQPATCSHVCRVCMDLTTAPTRLSTLGARAATIGQMSYGPDNINL